MKLLMRRAAFLAITIVVTVFSVAPHEHDGFSEVLRKNTVESIGECHNATAHHFHAARLRQPHPCAACLRQHSSGTLRLVAIPLAVRVTVATVVVIATSPRAGALVFTPSRGPPA